MTMSSCRFISQLLKEKEANTGVNERGCSRQRQLARHVCVCVCVCVCVIFLFGFLRAEGNQDF